MHFLDTGVHWKWISRGASRGANAHTWLGLGGDDSGWGLLPAEQLCRHLSPALATVSLNWALSDSEGEPSLFLTDKLQSSEYLFELSFFASMSSLIALFSPCVV